MADKGKPDGLEAGGWWVYIVECADGTFYTGITTDLERRVAEHNEGTGARYTRSRRPVAADHMGQLGKRLEAVYAVHPEFRQGECRIGAAADRMYALLNELLELSRVGRAAHEPRRVSLAELAREAAEQLAGPIAERRVELVISSRLPDAFGDPKWEAFIKEKAQGYDA